MRGLGWYLLLQLGSVRSFYVPGVAPIDFQIEEKLDIKAVKMTSSKTQLPYEYYSLPMCKPETVREIVFKIFRFFFSIFRPKCKVGCVIPMVDFSLLLPEFGRNGHR